MAQKLRVGADRLGEFSSLFRDARVGLVTTPTGRTGAGESTIAALGRACRLCALFAPEHGVRGEFAAGASVPSYIDAFTGLPVYSLYGSGSRRFSPELLDTFDMLVYDIQDVGSRTYTFLSTLLYAVEDCARAGKPLVVLDRPNPLGGRIVEGNLPVPELLSFVGCYPLPNRYGLTAGEFAAMANRERELGCALTIIPCEGWRRDWLFPAWGRPWVLPSLNIPRFETALLYAGVCLFEGTNLSEGRGTADPFAILGAPWIRDAEELAAGFNQKKQPGVWATPQYFAPTASKHQGQVCGGVHLHVTDPRALRPLAAALFLLELVRDRYERDFAFLPPAREGGRPFISLLAGHQEFERPGWTAAALLERGQKDARRFARRKGHFHLY